MKKFLIALVAFCTITSSAAFAAPESTPAPEPTSAPEAAQVTETAQPEPSASPEAAQTETPEAEPSETPMPTPESTVPPAEAVPEKEMSTQFTIDVTVIPRKYIISTNAVFELYDMNDNLLGSCLHYIGWDTPTVQYVFDVPQYRMGEKFKVKLVSGVKSIFYYDQQLFPGDTFEVYTYGCFDENGEYVQSNGVFISADPEYEKEINMYITDRWRDDISPRARIIDGVEMVPLRAVGEAMGLDVYYNPELNNVSLSLADHVTVFWPDNEYMAYPGGDKNALHKPVCIDGSMFVPARDLAEAFECPLEITNYETYTDILIGEIPYRRELMNRIPVNRDGIGSKTNYLIWVSKSEYKVRVYLGQQYNWQLVKEYPCALGAWNTPTITGQFEIIERTQWDYDTYYVGPVLRFYNGYALHSTLLYYGGGEYDGRVGVNISHGCVRLHPSDINWIAAYVPMHTRVYITE